MTIDLTDNKKYHPFDFTVMPHELRADGEITAAAGADGLHVVGKAEKKDSGHVRVAFQLTGELIYPCSRCLAPVSKDVVYDYDEDIETDGDSLDLLELVEDCLFINEPYQVLCKEDCRGLCPVCGADLNTQSCSCHEEADVDPRLEVLKTLL